eukprot:TRINITY_DN10633_c0_g1::TRINITY_DN10633_c0_g1_i1::g.10972::m.10972 TRINITY_DN10633_c0_g1::TRINITY_DN10633_c0_g1_i1::g.10972  ORF type:complete len:207 (+),score=9.99,sp/Q9FHW2/SWC6_ARATH/43.45/1e-29,zf-HIT/PF04438.11/2.1e-08,NTR2/PF15458.1/0.0038 TRINITY_DN10633_c0_g1_i1:54-623(+)
MPPRRAGGIASALEDLAGASSSTGRTTRKRQVSEKLRVIDAATRARIVSERLDALENDAHEEAVDNQDDDEYVPLLDEDDNEEIEATGTGGRKRKRGRKGTRGAAGDSAKNRLRKPFSQLLAEMHYESYPSSVANYMMAAALPSHFPARNFCSVCGLISGYSCVRCGMRFCSVRCNTIHQDTRCLKFTV